MADANVWLAIAFSGHFHHAAARKWFDSLAGRTCAFCRITQLALLRHLTNSKIMAQFVQSQAIAWSIYDKLSRDPRVLFLAEPQGLEVTFRDLSKASSPSHLLWTDAYLAAFAMESQARLVTFDQGFSQFVGLDLHLLN